MRKWLFIGFVFALLILAAPASAQGDAPDALIPFECPPYGLTGYTLTCGFVSVPADHTAPSDTLYQIAVVIVHRDGVDAAPDPLVYVNGGPGAKTLASLPLYVSWLDPYLQDRDVILFDARGVGASQPALECPNLDAAFFDGADEDGILEAAGTCYDDLSAAGVDPSLFTSAQIAGDLAVMREALGYEEWNLYGLSYGSRHVLTALRDYPQGIRSAIVDAAVTPEADILNDAPANTQRAFERLSDECHRDMLCRAAYPDIVGTLNTVVERLNDEPVTLELELEDGSITTAELDGDGFKGNVLGMLASSAMVPSVPAVIYNADQGDFETLIQMQTAIAQAMRAGGNAMPSTRGQAFSIICAEEAPFNSEVSGSAVSLTEFCPVWPVTPLGDIEDQPVSSDVPTLFGSGAYDSLLTPEYARSAAEHFETAYVVEAADQAHGIFNLRGCGTSIGRAFLADPTSAPDASCFTSTDTPQWVITVDFARPISRILGAVLAIAGVVLAGYGSVIMVEMARARHIAWRATQKAIGVWPLGASVGIGLALWAFAYAIRWEPSPYLLIGIAVSLGTAVQVVMAMSAADEPALEIVLTLPQPYSRIKLSQLALIFASQIGLALVASLAVVLFDSGNFAEGVLNWLAPLIFLSGIAALLTMRTNHTALAAMIIILAALGIAIAGDNLLPAQAMQKPWPMPASLIQPFAWMIHPYLQPESLGSGSYLVNRAIVSGLGLLMLARALVLTRNSEKMLMAHKSGN